MFLRQSLAGFFTARALSVDSPVYNSLTTLTDESGYVRLILWGFLGRVQGVRLAQQALLPVVIACQPSCFFMNWASHGFCCNEESRHIWLLWLDKGIFSCPDVHTRWHNVVGLTPESSPSQMSLGKSATSVCLQAPFGKASGYEDSNSS